MFALANYGSDDDSSDASRSSSSKAAATASNGTKTAAENSSSSSRGVAVIASLIPRPNNVQGASAGWICGDADHLTELPISFLGEQGAASKPPTPTNTTATTTTPPLAEQLRQHKDFFNPKQMEQTVKSLNIHNPFASSCADTSNFAEWERDLLILEEQAREGGGGGGGFMAASDNAGGVQASDSVQDQISAALSNTHYRA